jgi:nucleoside phosphorylase
LKIDFAVIATLDEEYDAVKEVFQLQEKDLKSEKNFSYYYKKIEEVGVAFFKFTERGNLNSSSQTTEIIRNFSPRFIILVGIAGGVKKNINLGDVAVSDNVEYYEYKKPIKKESIHDRFLLNRLLRNLKTLLKTLEKIGRIKLKLLDQMESLKKKQKLFMA